MNPYIGDDAVIRYCEDAILPSYREAGREPDAGCAVWPARAVYDQAAGLSWQAACWKQLRACREALGLPVVKPSQPATDIALVMANFCNLTDSVPRPIFSSCLAGQSPEMQDEWITRERLAGGTHMVFSIQAGYTDYPPEINFYVENRMGEWLTTLDRVLNASLVPVVFLHSGGSYPGSDYFHGVLSEIPRDYYDRCLWVPAWEPVRGSWSSRQFREASLAIRAALGPSPLMGCHLSQGRLSFSSNPVEPDDPWHGQEAACWREQWGGDGHPFAVFLYQ